MGHEGCGIVEEIGEGVTTVKVGDKVVMHWRPGSGIEAPFPSYVLDGKSMSSGKCTTLSEYSIVSENRLTTVPQDTPEDLCAILGCALTTAMGIIDNEVDLKFGESVAVIGCGGAGCPTRIIRPFPDKCVMASLITPGIPVVSIITSYLSPSSSSSAAKTDAPAVKTRSFLDSLQSIATIGQALLSAAA